ncbi:MAG: choice-of-anchor R domain-containing protein [Terriglobales bacterium]
MKKRIALSVSSLVLFASLNLAALGQNQYVFSPDLKSVRATQAPTHITPAPKRDAALTTIAGNFSRYPEATYFSVWGNTIAQGGENFPFQVWEAIPFTPTADATVTKLQVSAGRQGGGTAGFELGLYNDAGGVPGTVIKSEHVTNLPAYGECCAVAEADDPAGIPVIAGTQYWVVVSTTAEDTDIYAWAFNSTNMTATLAAEWCQGSSTYCGENSGKWSPYQYVQLGFNVLGH